MANSIREGAGLRRYLIPLLVISLLFTGCFGTKKSTTSTSLQLSVELSGSFGSSHELLVSGGGKTYLVELGSQKIKKLSLKSGTWSLEAISRSETGEVISQTERAVVVKGGGERVVNLDLQPTSHETTEVRVRELTQELLPGGDIQLSWDAEGSGEGVWELWAREMEGILWEKKDHVPFSNRSFTISQSPDQIYIFAVRFIPAKESSFWSSPLESLPTGQIEISWDFEHHFPQVFLSAQQQMGLGLAADPSPGETFSDLIAHFTSEDSFARREEILAKLGLELKNEIPSLLVALVEPKSGSESSLEEWAYYEDADLFLEPNWTVSVNAVAVPNWYVPWYLEYVRIPQAQAITTGSQSVRIAILDTGLNNPAGLGSGVKALPGYNFIGNNGDTTDDHKTSKVEYHGTKIAKSIVEVIPEVSIQPVKVLDHSGSGNSYQLANGLLYAAGLHHSLYNPTPANILNLSLGSSANTYLQEEVERVVSQAGAIIIAASGNKGLRGVFYPAAYREVVAVGAIEPGPNGPRRAYYSNYGSQLDLVAPPTFIDGTSFATAIVSGVAGLMLANGTPVYEIRDILTTTAIDLGLPGLDEEYGYGLVNAHWAVRGVSHLTLELRTEQGVLYQEKIPLGESVRSLQLVPGEYTVRLMVDLTDGIEPQTGDYLAQTKFTLQAGKRAAVELSLRELRQ